MHIYIQTELFQVEIAKQEFEFDEAINGYSSPPSADEVHRLAKETFMSRSEFRVWITEALGIAWETLTNDPTNESIAASWDCTGLNLPVDGSQDDKWKIQMLQKYAGVQEDDSDFEIEDLHFKNPLTNTTRGFHKVNAYKMIYQVKKKDDDSDDEEKEKEKIQQFLQSEGEQDVKDDDDIDIDNNKTSKANNKNGKKKKTKTKYSFNNQRLRPQRYKVTLPQNAPIIPIEEPDVTQTAPWNNNNNNNTMSPMSISTTTTSMNDNNNNNNNNNNTSSSQMSVSTISSSSSNNVNNNNSNSNSASSVPYQYVGIHNVYGSNCYISSFIQSITFIPQYKQSLEILQGLNYQAHESDFITQSTWYSYITILRKLHRMIEKILNPMKINPQTAFLTDPSLHLIVINPKKFIDALPLPWNNKRQQDVHEFIQFIYKLLTGVRNNSITKPTIITNSLQSSTYYMTQCKVCSKIRKSPVTKQYTLEVIVIYIYIKSEFKSEYFFPNYYKSEFKSKHFFPNYYKSEFKSEYFIPNHFKSKHILYINK